MSASPLQPAPSFPGIRIIAPGRSSAPSVYALCGCKQFRRGAVGNRQCQELLADWNAHRAACGRGQQKRRAA